MATEKAKKTKNAAEQAINTVLAATEDMATKSAEAVDTAVSMSEKAILDGMDQADAFAKEQSSAFQSGYTQASTTATENLDVAFKAAKDMTQGWNAYTQQIMDYTKKAFAENMVTAEKFAAAKTPEEFIELNNEVASTAANRISGQSSKLNDIVQKTAAKAGQPVVEQIEKNIAPADSVFEATKLYSGQNKFVMAGSGHIAGVINPPSKNKYQFWTNDAKKAPTEFSDWAEGATETAGSWWPDWHKWLSKKYGAKVAARKPGGGKLKVIEAAPGSYVKVRS